LGSSVHKIGAVKAQNSFGMKCLHGYPRSFVTVDLERIIMAYVVN